MDHAESPPGVDALDTWLLWGADLLRWRPKTRATYRTQLRQWLRWCHEHGIDPRLADPADLVTFWRARPVSASTRNATQQALRAWGKWLVATGVREDNPADALPRAKPQDPIPRALTAEECQALLRSAEELGALPYTIVSVLLGTGLRINELRHLRWADVHGDFLAVVEGKGGRERVIPLPPPTVAALRAWRQHCADPAWVLPSPVLGKPLGETAIRRWVRLAGDDAGIQGLQPHQCRHSVATRLLELGADVRSVQAILGHASLATTQRYLRVRPHRLAEAMARLDFHEPTEPAA